MRDARGDGYLARPSPSGLADVVELILDKGLVIDAYVRVSLLGIELLTIDARIVVASVDTYLRFAEATNRLDLEAVGPRNPIDILTDATEQAVADVASTVVERKVEGVIDQVTDKVEDVADAVEGAVDTAKSKAAHLLRPDSS